MGIYIKDMEMPKRGMVVNIYADGRVTNHFDEFGKTKGKAVSVPPHGDLISRECLIDIALHLMNTAKNEDIANGVKWLWQYIIEAPTIIPAEEGE